MGSSQSLPSFVFPEMNESDLKTFVSSLNSFPEKMKFERTLGRGRVSWSMLVRQEKRNLLLLMRLYAKNSSSSISTSNSKTSTITGTNSNFNSSGKALLARRKSSLSTFGGVRLMGDPLSATKLSFIHELYFEKCSQFDFVLKPLMINDSDEFLVVVRPFARYNLPDCITTESLGIQDKIWIGMQLIDNFIKLQGLKAYHGDFGTGKVLLTSQNKVLLSDFAPIKPFSLQSSKQSPIEFYQIWFDEGLDGDLGEVGRGCYSAPERLKFISSSTDSLGAADLFSLGCVLAELFSAHGESFLDFKNVLKLSLKTFNEFEAYEKLINEFLKRIKVKSELCPLIQRLCSQDPMKRTLCPLDLEILKSMMNLNFMKWNKFVDLYRLNEDLNFNDKKKLIQNQFDSVHKYNCELPDNFNCKQLETLLLMILREKEALLRVLLLNLFFENLKNVEESKRINCDELFEALRDEGTLMTEDLITKNLLMNSNVKLSNIPNHFSLIKAFNNFNANIDREALFHQILKEPDLKIVLHILELKNFAKEKVADVLIKLLQIYRARGLKDFDFESRLAFWFFAANVQEEEVKALFKSCSLNTAFQLHRPIKRDQLGSVVSTRIAYQFDLEKNKVPIEIVTNVYTPKKTVNVNRNGKLGRLKQRLLIDAIPWKFAENENCLAIIQSPDRSFFLMYSQSTLYFWDIKEIITTDKEKRRKQQNLRREALAGVCPRADGVICSVVFNDNNSLYIAFKDGIIGLYKIDIIADKFGNLGFKGFSIKESFGPFQSDFKLLIFETKSGPTLLVLESRKIIGIEAQFKTSEFGSVFEIDLNFILKSFNKIGGCLLCLDPKGKFYLVEIYYETGHVLGTWKIKSENEIFIEAIQALDCENLCATNINQVHKYNLMVEMTANGFGKVICVFAFDPLCEFDIPCVFRHWKIDTDDTMKNDVDKNLPEILLLRDCHNSWANAKMISIDSNAETDLKYSNSNNSTKLKKNSNTILMREEIVELSDGVLRLIDWTCLTTANATSILYPSNYKPSLRLRNKKGSVPEIVEKAALLQGDIFDNVGCRIARIVTVDEKHSLIISLVDSNILIFC